MKQKILFFAVLVCTLFLFACPQGPAGDQNSKNDKSSSATTTDNSASKKQIAAMLDSFNVVAARADYDAYFNFYTADATFLGTDATEHWDKKAFMVWAKPFFDRKKAWNFTSIQRNIYFGKYEDIAWFDELLSTQMKICRGSGVVVKQNNEWKLQQYVLSMTIPNSVGDSIVVIKAEEEDSIMKKISGK